MKCVFRHCVAMALLWVFGAIDARSNIIYIDATPTNTTLQGAALIAGANHTTGTQEGAMDNLWHFRDGVGNGGGVWTADELTNGTEEVAALVTTITLPAGGGYQIFAYIWNSEAAGEDWDVKIRIEGQNGFSKVQSTEVDPADSASFAGAVITSEGSRHLMQIPLGVVTVIAGGTVQIYVDDDSTTGSRRTWYDGIGYERVFSELNERVVAIDFNKGNVAGTPVQAMFRSISGSSTTSQNSTNITKAFGPYIVQCSKTSPTPFDFRGPNGDATHLIPGGSTSYPFLVADFLGSRDGTINLKISNLEAGTYFFRSYHLDTFNGANFGFAQGSSSTTQNTLRARLDGGLLGGIVQPTVLAPLGLNTNFISNADIPVLTFPFVATGSNVILQISSIYTNGTDRFIFLNGFEIFSTRP